MRIVTLCLLVIASTCCLLGKVESGASIAPAFEEVQPFGDDGFLKTMEKVFKKILTTVSGVNCTIKQVIEVMIATTNYVDALGGCTTDIPKDIAKIVKSCQNIISICENIIHMKSTICHFEEDAKMTGLKCFWGLFESLMKLTRNINVTLKLMAKLPTNTEDCYVDATHELQDRYNAFMPGIMKCIDEM